MRLVKLVDLILILFLVSCASQTSPAPAATATSTATIQPSATATWLPTATPTASPTPLPSSTPTPTPLPPAVLGGTPVPQAGLLISSPSVGLVRELARWGRGNVEDLDWSPDGNFLVARTASGGFIYQPGTAGEAHFIEGSLVFGSQGLLAAADFNGNISVWRISDWTLLYTLLGAHPQFSPDGQQLAFLGEGGAHLVRSADARPIAFFKHQSADRLVFSPTGNLLVTVSRDDLKIWKPADGSLAFSASYFRVLRVQYTAPGELLLVQNRTAANAAGIDIYRLKDGSLAGSIQNGGGFAVQPDGQQVFVFSNYPLPGRIESYALPEGKKGADIRAGGSIYRLAVSPDSKILAVSVPDPNAGALLLYDATTGKQIRRLVCEHSCDARSPLFSPDGRLVAMTGHMPTTGVDIGTTAVYDTQTGRLNGLFRSQHNQVGQVEQAVFSPDSSRLAVYTGGMESSLAVWDFATANPVFNINWASYLLTLGNLSADGRQVAAADQQSSVLLINPADGSIIKRFESATFPLLARQGDFLLAAGQRASRLTGLRLWKASSAESLLTFANESVPAFALSPVEDLVAVPRDSAVRLYRLPTGKLSASLVVDKPAAHLLITCFSPDGLRVAAGDGDGQVWVWQTADRRLLYTLAGHSKAITGLSFSPDGSLLATASQDGLVRLWNPAGQMVQSINANDLVARSAGTGGDLTFGLVGGLDFSPDGQILAVSGVLNPLLQFPGRVGAVLLVQAGDGSLLRLLRGGGGPVQFDPSGRRLLASGDGAIHVFAILK